MIAVADFRANLRVDLPALSLAISDKHFAISTLLADISSGHFEAVILEERRGIVKRARLTAEGRDISLVMTSKYQATVAPQEIFAPDAHIRDGVLHFGEKTQWKTHPLLARASEDAYANEVLASWQNSVRFRGEVVNAEGALVEPGLRLPQLGALHALAAHWSTKSNHAKVVLPTGTGKTEVMIAAMLLRRPKRTLLLVPSDALRTQLTNKFERIGLLRELNVVDQIALNPVVGRMLRAPSTRDDIHLGLKANLVVSTIQMLLGMSDDVLTEFLDSFELLFFDEAHHLPAASWTRITQHAPEHAAIVSVTATPFRNDGKRIPGDLVYQFPLRLAQEMGYFKTINVIRVEEYDESLSDRSIALRAIERQREDRELGFEHTIFARARSIDHADRLHELYSVLGADLNSVVLHSRVPANEVARRIESLKSLHSKIVICVDMLGEGFDFPALKIAALHDIHKSLPVTLQFIGRFTRTADRVGEATVVINMAESMAETAVAGLFSDDADWNELIPDLSARAARSEEDMGEFMAAMRPMTMPGDTTFDLALLRPKVAVNIFRNAEFRPNRLEQSLPPGAVLYQTWRSEDESLLVFVTQDRIYPDWSTSRGAMGLEWNLGVIAHEPEHRLLYMNTSYSASRTASIAKKLGGDNTIAINGENVFRAFDGLHRAVLHNVGLYRRGGGLKFQMLAGVDIGEYVTNAVQAGSSKSNLLAIGYEQGRKSIVGASAKGRIWAMSNSSIPDWLNWSKRVAEKITNAQIPTDTFLRFALVPREIVALPETHVFTCIPPNELLPGWIYGNQRILIHGIDTLFSQIDISFEWDGLRDGVANIRVLVGTIEAEMSLSWHPSFSVRQERGPAIRVRDGRDEVPLDEFLSMHPPGILLADGTEVLGKYHFYRPVPHPYVFDSGSILAIDWADTPIRVESKWRNGVQRDRSVQGFMIIRCLERDYDFVFDDDDSGELADIITIEDKIDERELVVTLFHCKYASGDEAGSRVKDLYEVCGQAVKSAKVLDQAPAILSHIISREGRRGGRPTRFERGNLADLRALQRRVSQYRLRLRICIVQPGLSADALLPEHSSILGAADGFIREFTGRRLDVFGSE